MTENRITISASGYYPKALYNSVRYTLDGTKGEESWSSPYTVTFEHLSDGWHTLKVELIDNGQPKLTKEIYFEVKRPIPVYVNGEKVDFPDQEPVILMERTLVPARGVFEKMGMQVSWDEEKQQVTVTDGTKRLTLVIGESRMLVDGEEKQMDVPAQTINDRTMIPLRAVSEALNAKVDWIEAENAVGINY